MGFLSLLIQPIANYVAKKIKKDSLNAVQIQQNILKELIQTAKNTAFGKDHNFSQISDYNSFKKNVSIVDYEQLKPYVKRIIAGESDVLWKGKPLYFAKTSGTTSGAKYIPLTKESMPNHFGSARNAVFMYIAETKNSSFVDGKMIFLSGSPEMDKTGDILTGRLSGIVNHHIPSIFRRNQKPSYETNCIDDWEEKLAEIVSETHDQKMTMISGIPPWVLMYFDALKEKTGQKIGDLFPKFSVFVTGGVNYEPYREKINKAIGRKVDMIETYPASEGFIAFQDTQTEDGLLLNINSGIFFEFIPTENYFDDNPTRLSLGEIELNKQYAIVLNTNAGLWGYSIGDTVKFVNKNPYRIKVTGRIKHFISAFGEHVIGEEVDKVMRLAIEKFDLNITEFTVAPQVSPEKGLPYHEWMIEFENLPENISEIELFMDESLRMTNAYYDDLLVGKVLKTLKITAVQKNAFNEYMKSQGKLGGQNKLPRLSNDRKIADFLTTFKL